MLNQNWIIFELKQLQSLSYMMIEPLESSVLMLNHDSNINGDMDDNGLWPKRLYQKSVIRPGSGQSSNSGLINTNMNLANILLNSYVRLKINQLKQKNWFNSSLNNQLLRSSRSKKKLNWRTRLH